MSSPNAILLRYAEIFIKKGNRVAFEKRLAKNIGYRLKPLGYRIERLRGRMVALGPAFDETTAEGAERARATYARALDELQHVFGLVSVSPAIALPRADTLDDLGAIRKAALTLAQDAVAERGRKPTFKVETRRPNKRFPMNSLEVSAKIGAAIYTDLGLPVDVHHPELTIGVELGVERSFVFGDVLGCPGGLPLGTAGRVVLLLSGGIDSPVAGWSAMKRGCEVVPLYFHAFPYTGDKTKEKVVELSRKLSRWQGRLELYVAPFTRAQEAIRDACPPELLVVLYRRLMMRVAARICERTGARAIVTGESLGQVASQTLENLDAINRATDRLVLRPLIAWDKQETIAVARRIGTYEISTLPYDDCCSLFVPRHPATHARLDEVERAEARLDLGALVEQVVAGTELLRLAAEPPSVP